MPSLADDYIAQRPGLRPFYGPPPESLFTPPSAPPSWDSGFAGALLRYQERLGLKRSIQGNEYVVVTGQQPGLLTGPLYTIHKAVTAIRLAELVEQRTGKPCLPVFWVAGDDHDFEEIRGTHILTKDGQTLSLRYAPEAPQAGGIRVDGFPAYRIPLTANLHNLIDEAANAAPGSEHREEVRAFLHETLDISVSMADWFVRIMAGLFEDTGLLFFVPHIPEARRLATPVFERELAEPLRVTEAVNRAADALEAEGYAAQLRKNPNECAFFIEMGNRRRKVLYEDGRFFLPEESIGCTRGELAAILKATPERFSANAPLRCVVQQRLFPALAYVGGPGEMAYWAQLKPVFQAHSMDMPVVYPRARVVLSSLKLDQLRDKLGLGYADLLGPWDALEERALKAQASHPALGVLGEKRGAAEAAMDDMGKELAALGKAGNTASAMTASLGKRLSYGLDRVERALLREDKVKLEATQEQLRRLCAAFAPGHQPQERVYSVFSLLFAHGGELVPRLLREVDVESFELNEVTL